MASLTAILKAKTSRYYLKNHPPALAAPSRLVCTDLGAHPEYLGKDDIQLSKKESIEDTAKVLGRMFDGIEFRGFEHKKVEMLAEHSGVPVWNGLTDLWHQTQTLADFLTVKENFGRLEGIKFVYVGDGRNNVANSLLVGSHLLGWMFALWHLNPYFLLRKL